MKAFEIIQERQITNEVAPLAAFAIGGVAFTKILTIVGTFLTAMTLMDIYKFVDNLGEDPESATEDQWFDVFLDVLLLAIPGLAKYGKPYFARLIPAAWKKKAADHVKGIVLKRLRQDRAAANKKYGKGPQSAATTAKDRKALQAKHAAAKQAAKDRAAKSLDKLSGDALYKTVLKSAGAGVVASLAKNYWDQYAQLEADWAAYQAGDRETETFGAMEQAEAEKHAYELKKKILGELTVGVGTMVASMAIGKKIEMFGNFFGKIAGGGLVGGIFKVPAHIGAAIVKIGGPGIAMFMQTDTGRKILEAPIVESIVKMAGTITATTWDLLKTLVDQAAKALGIDLGIKTQPSIKRPEFKNTDPWGIAVTVDPTNPKMKYIGGTPVTDPNTGYLLTTIPNKIQMIKKTAQTAGQPDPTAKIPRDPNGQYTDYPV